MTAFTRARFGWKFLFAMMLSCILAVTSIPTASAEYHATTAETSDARFQLSTPEWCLIKRINRIRMRNGRGRLRPDKQLAYVARQHARTIASAGSVYHDPNMSYEVTRWLRLGENTGRGLTCKSLTRAFMRSSSHRAHILGRYRFIGVGTERRGGQLYVQQIFESRRDPGNVYHYP